MAPLNYRSGAPCLLSEHAALACLPLRLAPRTHLIGLGLCAGDLLGVDKLRDCSLQGNCMKSQRSQRKPFRSVQSCMRWEVESVCGATATREKLRPGPGDEGRKHGSQQEQQHLLSCDGAAAYVCTDYRRLQTCLLCVCN